MPSITRLFDGVFIFEGEVGGRPLRLTFLNGETSRILLDTGCATDVEGLILPSLEALGVPPETLTHLINTHCDLDHQGGNHGMKQLAPQAELSCGELDKPAIEDPATIFHQRYDGHRHLHGHFYDEPTAAWIHEALGPAQRVDRTWIGGERIELSPGWHLQVLHLPGHSHGHLGLLDERNQALYAGDAIHGAVYHGINGKAALCPTYLHVADYLATIRRIETLGLTTLLACHWPTWQGDEIARFCQESREFVERAEEGILRAIDHAPEGITMGELCLKVGPGLGSWPAEIHHELAYAFNGHLEDLERRGRIARLDTGRPLRFVSR